MLGLISAGCFLAAWQAFAMWLRSGSFASPVQVADSIIDLVREGVYGKSLTVHMLTSAEEVFSGYAAALPTGVGMGLLMARVRITRMLFDPLFRLIRPIPPIAWIPIAILWFGIGLPAKTFVIWLAAWVPCLINSYTGASLVPPILEAAARTLGLNAWQMFFRVVIPSSLPYIFTGARIALSNAWMNVVAAELLAATAGLGYIMEAGRRALDPGTMFASMTLISLWGAGMNIGLQVLERRLIPWGIEQRA